MNNILWTGGWDSSFRVLDLLLRKQKNVQPYYIYDAKRKSVQFEMNAMETIKKMAIERDPKVEELIKDTIVVDIEDIPKNQKITESYKRLHASAYLGVQYDWLARFVESQGIIGLELSIHKDDKATKYIKNEVTLITEENDSYYVLKNDSTNKELDLFSNYHFPLLDLTKPEMGEIAKRSGFAEIMEETWFCHRPTKEGHPCGMCNPCKYTREEGMGRRVPTPPLSTRLNHQIKGKIKGLKSKIISK